MTTRMGRILSSGSTFVPIDRYHIHPQYAPHTIHGLFDVATLHDG